MPKNAPALKGVCSCVSSRRVVFALSLAGAGLGLCRPERAHAGDWGVTVGYNNPAGANIGANVIFIGQTFAFEAGVGGLGGTVSDKDADGNKDSTSGGLWGDIDMKVMFGQKWRPYIEAGFGMALGAGAGKSSGVSAGAGSPFAGVGILFSGSPLLFYLAGDYKFNTKDLFPVVGIGVKF